MPNERCIYCGEIEYHQNHDRRHPKYVYENVHEFRSLAYVEALEDALMFVRENKAAHTWEYTGITVDVGESFPEKYCTVCGGINWGGKEDGICFGNNLAERAVIEAHNRRAGRLTIEAIQKRRAR